MAQLLSKSTLFSISFFFLAICHAADPLAPNSPSRQAAKNDYSLVSAWLCRPGSDDYCLVNLSTTIIDADGSTRIETYAANPDAPIDCFYIYPTVSMDTTGNSDMSPGPGEINVIRAQFARFGSKCRTFAPLYRQVTLSALRAVMLGEPLVADREMAYNDVRDAWNYYLENNNNGRGVVLVGHSQGAGMLTELITREIEGKPIQRQIVSALIIGSRPAVPRGELVGGTFKRLTLCTSADQIGCIISFASFRDRVPPPADSRFGKVPGENMVAACTNPAALGGGKGELHAYLSTAGSGASALKPQPWLTSGTPITTPFVSLPGMLYAQCVDDGNASYLAVSVQGDPGDGRTDDIVGDVVLDGAVQAAWGLHLIDMNLAMGNLLEIVEMQAKNYTQTGATDLMKAEDLM